MCPSTDDYIKKIHTHTHTHTHTHKGMHTSLLCLPPSSPGWRTLRPPLRPVPPFLLSWILLPSDALMGPTPGTSIGARMQLFLLQRLLLPALLEERGDKEKPGRVVSRSLNSCAGPRLSWEPGSGAHYRANAGSSPAGASARIPHPEGRSVHLGGTEAASCCGGACPLAGRLWTPSRTWARPLTGL